MSDYAETSTPRAPIDLIAHPFAVFARHKLTGAALLVAAAFVAMAWANSPWSASYRAILDTVLGVSVGDFQVSKPLLLWINDGLMGFFFFVVGLEIKRELIAGELASPRKAVLPLVAAIGGMVVPALIYLAINWGGPGQRGWGVPVATDIAFTLGVIALVGSRAPVGLKVFLTALSIADDIGAILVIAIFYSEAIGGTSLLAGLVLVLISVAANAVGVRNSVVYFVIGTLAWLAFLESGVHATLAALLLALTIPAKTKIDGEALCSRIGDSLKLLVQSGLPTGRSLLTKDQQDVLQGMARTVDDASAPLQTLEHTLMPFVSFLVLPAFALANGGVVLEGSVLGAFRDPVFLGIVLGLFVGKQAGVLLFSWAAVRLGLADLPEGVGWRQIHAAGILAGIGFTMSLFVGSLAFTDPGLHQISKAGVLVGSLLSAIAGWALLRFSVREEA